MNNIIFNRIRNLLWIYWKNFLPLDTDLNQPVKEIFFGWDTVDFLRLINKYNEDFSLHLPESFEKANAMETISDIIIFVGEYSHGEEKKMDAETELG